MINFCHSWGPRSVTHPVIERFVETPTLPTPGLDRPSRRTEKQPGTYVHDPPVRTGPVAGAFMKGPKLSWDMKGADRPDDTLDSGMGTVAWGRSGTGVLVAGHYYRQGNKGRLHAHS